MVGLLLRRTEEEFEDTKGSSKSGNQRRIDRQYSDQKKRDKRTNNIPQNTMQKTKDWVTGI